MLYNQVQNFPYLNAEGRVIFRFSVRNAMHTVFSDAWWATGPNGFDPVPFGRIGDPPPGTSGLGYASIDPAFGDGGGPAFGAELRSYATQSLVAKGVFVGTPGDVRLAALSGVPMDVLGGGTFDRSHLGTWLMTNGSLTVFNGRAHLNSSPEITYGLWLASADGSVRTLALEGGNLTFDLVPRGIDETGRVGIYNNLRMYVATPGDVRPAAYAGPVTTATYTGSGVWVFEDLPGTRIHALHPSGTLKILCIAGTQAPGMPEGVTFKEFDEFSPSRSAENVLFRATLNGPGIDPTEEMTFASVNGQKRLLARAGRPAPGLGPDTYFLGFSEGAVNDAGQVVMFASLTGPGVTTDNDNALWYDAGDGVLRVLLREGDPLDFDGQSLVVRSFRSATKFWSSGGIGGDTFNNAGQFVCGLTFTDGSSGVFLFQIPEPSTTAAAVAMVVGTLALGKRRPRAGRPRHG